MRWCRASSSVRLRGPAGGSGQGHAATWTHRAHLLAPVDAAEDTVSFPRGAGRCVGGGRAATKGRDGGARGRPTSVGGGPGSPAGGRGHGAGSPCERLPLDLPSRVVRENPVVVEGGDEVVPSRAVVPLGGGLPCTRGAR